MSIYMVIKFGLTHIIMHVSLVLMDDYKEVEALIELSKIIAFKPNC